MPSQNFPTAIRGPNEFPESCFICRRSGSQLHMAHELARAFQHARRIRQRCAVKEPHVHVRTEYVHVAEGCISQTRDRTAVMQNLPHFVPAFPHHCKPLARDRSQCALLLFHPRIDPGIPLDPAVEPQQFRPHPCSTFRSRDLWFTTTLSSEKAALCNNRSGPRSLIQRGAHAHQPFTPPQKTTTLPGLAPHGRCTAGKSPLNGSSRSNAASRRSFFCFRLANCRIRRASPTLARDPFPLPTGETTLHSRNSPPPQSPVAATACRNRAHRRADDPAPVDGGRLQPCPSSRPSARGHAGLLRGIVFPPLPPCPARSATNSGFLFPFCILPHRTYNGTSDLQANGRARQNRRSAPAR